MSTNGSSSNTTPNEPTTYAVGFPDVVTKKDRMTLVRQLRMKGLTVQDIVDFMGISERTVYNYLSEMKMDARRAGVTAEHWEELGDAKTRYDDFIIMAMAEAEGTENGNEKHKWMKLAMAAHEKKTLLLLDVGVLRRAPTRIQHEEVPLAEMSLDELRRKKLELVQDLVESLPAEDMKKIIPIVVEPVNGNGSQ